MVSGLFRIGKKDCCNSSLFAKAGEKRGAPAKKDGDKDQSPYNVTGRVVIP